MGPGAMPAAALQLLSARASDENAPIWTVNPPAGAGFDGAASDSWIRLSMDRGREAGAAATGREASASEGGGGGAILRGAGVSGGGANTGGASAAGSSL